MSNRVETVAKLLFEYDGVQYPLEYSFCEDYPISTAYFIFEEGNYSCDCNRSIFIRMKYGDMIPELGCGERIKLLNIEVVSRPPSD